jgi:hypothetical protein
MGDINPAQYLQFVPVDKEVVPQDPGISDMCIFVKGDGQALLAGLFDQRFPFLCT